MPIYSPKKNNNVINNVPILLFIRICFHMTTESFDVKFVKKYFTFVITTQIQLWNYISKCLSANYYRLRFRWVVLRRDNIICDVNLIKYSIKYSVTFWIRIICLVERNGRKYTYVPNIAYSYIPDTYKSFYSKSDIGSRFKTRTNFFFNYHYHAVLLQKYYSKSPQPFLISSRELSLL